MYAAFYLQCRYIEISLTGRLYILRLKIKINEICKFFDRMQKSFHGIVLLGTIKQIDGTMDKCTIATKVTRNRKVGWCHLWAEHHTGNSERLFSQQNISRTSEADVQKSTPASLFY